MSRFSNPVRCSSTAANWPDSPMRRRTSRGSATTSAPATRALPASGTSSVARIDTAVVLAGSVGAEQAQHRALGHGQIEPVQGGDLPVPLHQAAGFDEIRHGENIPPALA